MEEETVSKIRDYLTVLGELKQEGVRPLAKVTLGMERERLESELGEELVKRIQRGEFDWILERENKPECDVLVLTANPADKANLAGVEKEADGIRSECEQATPPMAALPRFGGVEEVGQWILEFRPKIVHFAGHGGKDGTLWLEEGDGRGAGVNAEAIAHLMRLRGWRLNAVFLNACWSERAADPFLDLADWVIGMKAEVGDVTATKFAKFFYRGLADGMKVPTAFEWGLGELALGNRSGDVVKLIRGDRPLSGQTTGFDLDLDDDTVLLANAHIEVVRGDEVKKPALDTARKYPVWFGTNRKPNKESGFTKGFGSERDDKVWYGSCEVTIPKAHKVGGVGSGWWKRLVSGEDRLLVDWDTLSSLEAANFWESVRRLVEQHVANGEEDPMAMVYVHGYNVTFEDAAIRAAQIGCDLKLPGPMAFYSWPSKGTLKGYLTDSNTVLGCVPFLVEFLRGFVAEMDGKVKKIHVLAHSMGNRLVLDAVKELNHELGHKVFDQVILAAADVDRQQFQQYAEVYSEIATQTTMYVSDRDRALQASEFVNDADRAGYFDPITLVKGIDTIRANHVSQGWLGHGYYAEARPILTDIYQMVTWGAKPRKRSTIDEVDDDSGLSWELAE